MIVGVPVGEIAIGVSVLLNGVVVGVQPTGTGGPPPSGCWPPPAPPVLAASRGAGCTPPVAVRSAS